MKFTVLAILPGLVMVNLYVWVDHHSHSIDETGPIALLTLGVWVMTWCVLAVYWAARIVRHVLRGPQDGPGRPSRTGSVLHLR